MSEQVPELLLCPFCGNKAAWANGEQKTKYGNEQVYCATCYANTAPEMTHAEAADNWNVRADLATAQLAAAVAEARSGQCVWTFNGISTWYSQCGRGLGGSSNTMTGYGFAFCPYCGKHIVAAARTEEEKESE